MNYVAAVERKLGERCFSPLPELPELQWTVLPSIVPLIYKCFATGYKPNPSTETLRPDHLQFIFPFLRSSPSHGHGHGRLGLGFHRGYQAAFAAVAHSSSLGLFVWAAAFEKQL